MSNWRRRRQLAKAAVLAALLACAPAVVHTPSATALPLPEYQIKFGHDNTKCLDLQYGAHVARQKIQQWTCALPGQPNMGNQLWDFEIFANGTAYLHHRNRSGWCMEPLSVPAGDRTPVGLLRCEPGLSQWIGVRVIDGATDWYQLKHVPSGKCLDVPNASTTNGQQLQVFTCVTGNWQQYVTWYVP